MDADLEYLLLGEAQLQALFALIGARLLKEAEGRGVDGAEQLWFSLQAILTAAANIDKCLWSGAREPTRAGQIAERRGIRQALSLDDNSCLHDIGIRNSLEHFDDRLGRWYSKASPRQSWVGRAVVRGDQIGINPRSGVDVFVEYEPESGVITFGNKSASITAITAECQRIVDRHAQAVKAILN